MNEAIDRGKGYELVDTIVVPCEKLYALSRIDTQPYLFIQKHAGSATAETNDKIVVGSCSSNVIVMTDHQEEGKQFNLASPRIEDRPWVIPFWYLKFKRGDGDMVLRLYRKAWNPNQTYNYLEAYTVRDGVPMVATRLIQSLHVPDSSEIESNDLRSWVNARDTSRELDEAYELGRSATDSVERTRESYDFQAKSIRMLNTLTRCHKTYTPDNEQDVSLLKKGTQPVAEIDGGLVMTNGLDRVFILAKDNTEYEIPIRRPYRVLSNDLR